MFLEPTGMENGLEQANVLIYVSYWASEVILLLFVGNNSKYTITISIIGYNSQMIVLMKWTCIQSTNSTITNLIISFVQNNLFG